MITQASRTHILHAQPRPQSAPAPNYLQQIAQGITLVAGGAVAVAQGVEVIPQCAPDRQSPLR